MKSWYVSVMLNRLMFIYFLQKKGFLDNNRHYLRTKLTHFLDHAPERYYADFLCPLFFEGFAKPPSQRSSATKQLLGDIPYLNGGLFLKHQIEMQFGQTIQIADVAFEQIFAFFERYDWHLDDRPLRKGNEINPDVLGYIFEKYINQKQMGAYYTKEDITDYIGKNTLIPYLFHSVQEQYPRAFAGPQAIWQLLQHNPKRYLYEAVKHGLDLPLPEALEKGLNDVNQRNEWQKPAPEAYALPTETWREVVARRQRATELLSKLANGEIKQINDLITYNLNIRQFAQDVIEECEDHELLNAIWQALQTLTILDPACGSGAFLFAALNILEPLYTACLQRMEGFGPANPTFQALLAQAANHPNRAYYLLKTIMLNNLYGVDIMPEATEICKLRLFLKLFAQIEQVGDLEPLPDIDFNVQAGNSLIGFVNYEAVKLAIQQKFDFENALAKIEEDATFVDRMFSHYRQSQLAFGSDLSLSAKQQLREALEKLANQLNHYLAREYGKDDAKSYQKWLEKHQPLHWFIEFHGIMQRGGFDVIIGNPPYVEYSKVKKDYQIEGYETESCGNLYAFMMERSLQLLQENARTGMIVPNSLICTDRMDAAQNLFSKRTNALWISTYCIRPAKLFVGVDQRLTVYILQRGENSARAVYSSRYQLWYEEFRSWLFDSIQYVNISQMQFPNSFPKLYDVKEQGLWHKLMQCPHLSSLFAMPGKKEVIYFHNAPFYWIRAMDFAPYFWNERSGEQLSTQIKQLNLPTKLDASVIVATLNSTLFYWWFVILSDCRHLNLREIQQFPLEIETMSAETKQKLADLATELMLDLRKHAQRKNCSYKTTGKVSYDEFYPKHSKPIIDEIDKVLAQHYGFTPEELDFILNYNLKCRLGKEVEDEEAA
jgi:hypothetical protein